MQSDSVRLRGGHVQVLRNGRGLAGPPQDLMRGASQLGPGPLQDNSWPYFWQYPRANCEHVQKVVSIAAPANATLTEVLAVTVPAGFRFVLRKIMHTFNSGVGGAPVFVEGSGAILWTIDVDTPIGSVPLSGYGLPDLSNMKESRGSTQFGPWEIQGYNVFNPYQTLRYKVITTAAIAPGDPNYITCGLFGWWDKALE